MKIRNGFVSNSSSSSFVVIGKDKSKLRYSIPEYLVTSKPAFFDESFKNYFMIVPDTSSQLEFGWGFERYYGFGDKLNYAFAQIMRLDDENLKEDYKEMIRRVLRNHLPNDDYLNIKIDYNYFYWDSISDNQCLVDHQSAYYEWDKSEHEIFKSEEALENFLFNEESFIQCGNDNEDPTPEWEEARMLAINN